MTNKDYTINIVAGSDLFNRLEAEKNAKVPKSGNLFQSEPLCAFQRSVSARHIYGATLVDSNHGWTVRYESGLQNWSIIAGCRNGDLDGTFEDAVRFSKEWVAKSPNHRYVTHTVRNQA